MNITDIHKARSWSLTLEEKVLVLVLKGKVSILVLQEKVLSWDFLEVLELVLVSRIISWYWCEKSLVYMIEFRLWTLV